MTASIALFLIITAGALALFLSGRVRIDLAALLVIVALALSGLLPLREALAGFSSEAAIITASVFVISAGLAATGLADRVGGWIGALAGTSEWRTLLVVMPMVALVAAFTHQLMVVAMMLPVLLHLARARGLSPSRLLMPMAFAASLGTTLTVLGAPAFLLTSSLLHQNGQTPLGVFSILPLGLALTALGTLYMLLLRWLLPRRADAEADMPIDGLARYFTEITLPDGSRWAGRTMEEFLAQYGSHLQVADWLRNGVSLPRPHLPLALLAGDVLLVQASPEEIASFVAQPDLQLHAVAQAGETLPHGLNEGAQGKARLFQAMLAPQSALIGQTLTGVDFPARFGVIAVGLWRRDGWFRGELAQSPLEAGDLLVLWGPPEHFRSVAEYRGFLTLSPFKADARQRHKARTALIILALSVAAAASGLLPPALAFMSGALAMVLSGCVPADQGYRAIDLRPFLMIAAAIPLGVAMERSGTAAWLAHGLGHFAQGYPPFAVLLLLFAAAALLTQLLSDTATAALLVPVAIAFSGAVAVSPSAAAVTVTTGAVAAFLTPIGHHGSLLVLRAGNYRFHDFLLLGLPLTALIGVVTAWITPQLFPLA
ncbi:SLC13 family permease [Metallibacterium scheffleri]|uniref:SLC13 family permease n=1 Tax=Metallibacterium scheffleri TaxID=993689 RepID=A0A4S3KH03_9GAMM|nr:SLC13 family permease [Metallibacterium scheffleri]THD07568.1 SLC13 family permease [Metallibacterium scheffleri]